MGLEELHGLLGEDACWFGLLVLLACFKRGRVFLVYLEARAREEGWKIEVSDGDGDVEE